MNVLNKIGDWLIEFEIRQIRRIPHATPGPLALGAAAPKTRQPPPPAKGSSVYVIDANTRTFGFRMDAKAAGGKNPEVTGYDQYYLERRGMKNANLNRQAKRHWAQEMTASAVSATLKVSASYVEKIFACFSAGEGEEKKRLQTLAK